jgi:hypothetical protein
MPTDEQTQQIIKLASKFNNLSPEEQDKAIETLQKGSYKDFEPSTPGEETQDIKDMMALPSASQISPHLMSQVIRLVRIGEGGRAIHQMLVSQGITDEIADTVSRELIAHRHEGRRKDAIDEMKGGFGCVVVGVILTAVAYFVARATGVSRLMLVGGVILFGLGLIVHGLFRFLRYQVFR